MASSFGPVTIIPATAMRDNRRLLRGTNPRNSDVPINAAYYLTPQTRQYVSSGIPSTSYPTPIDRQRRRNSNFVPPPAPLTSVGNPGFVGPPPSSTYKNISGLGTEPESYRRSNHSAETRFYRNRSLSSSNVFDEGDGAPVRYFSGPIKMPGPMYKKRRYYRRTSSGGRTIHPENSFELSSSYLPKSEFRRSTNRQSVLAPGSRHSGVHRQSRKFETARFNRTFPPASPVPPPPSERRPRGLRRMYDAATYTTYPPSSIIYRQRRSGASSTGFTYSTMLRAILKLAQLVVGAVVIGTVCGPTRGRVLHEFAGLTRTQGQVAVVVFAALCLILTAGFLVTVNLAKSSQGWRITDAVFSGLAMLLYLISGGVESWYADCYPPFGLVYGVGNLRTCRLVEWVIAAIFAFFNAILYATDFGLSIQAGMDSDF